MKLQECKTNKQRHPNIINEAKAYAVIHEDINENEMYDIHENKVDENTFTYVSDITVSTEVSYLRQTCR